MASGTSDRLDVTTWVPSARSASATRSRWDTAGVAARAGDSTQDRFGSALSAAKARDETAAARARATDQRDQTDAARARQATQRDQTNASRAAADRARDAAVKADARAAGRPASVAKPASTSPKPAGNGRTDAAPGASASRAEPQGILRRADRPDTDPATPGKADPALRQPSDASASAQDPATGTAATTDAAVQSNAASAQPQQPQSSGAASQAASPDPAGALLGLIAALAGGAPAGATGTVPEQPALAPTEASAEGAASVSGTAPTPSIPGTAASGSSKTGTSRSGLQNAAETGSIALTGVAASGLGGGVAGATSPIAPTAAGKTVKDTAAVEAAPSGTGDPAGLAASADGPAKDFLAALADAGQGQTGIPGQVAAPAAQGAPPAAIAPMQNSGPAGTHSAAAPAQASAPAQADPAVPLGQVPMTIGLRSLGGSSEFQIRLDPAELGRIEVKLEIDKARGTVTTHLVVDRPDTLAMLQRDAGQLQQALAQTGLDPSGGGLNLSLRGDGSAQGDGRSGQGDAPRGGPATWSTDTAEATQETAPVRWLRGYGGVDIRI